MARTASRTTPNLGSQPLRGADFERAHSSVVLGEDVRDQRRGFTIVELLIVVVVIAILAAITIVAYNGITNRSKAAAASAAAEQAAKKVMTYAAVNSDQYPASLSDAGVSDGSATYQYRVDNSTSPKTFCLTATTQNISYFVSSASASPRAGACPGHGANGVAVVTNLATDPSATSLALFAGAGAAGTQSIVNGTGYSGGTYIRRTFAGAGDGGIYYAVAGITPGINYSVSTRVRTSKSMQMRASIYWRTTGGGVVGSVVDGPPLASSAGDWSRLEVSGNAPAGAGIMYLAFYTAGGTWAADDWLDVDAIMVTSGNLGQNYADGDSPGWIWNGTPNNSTSTGPSL